MSTSARYMNNPADVALLDDMARREAAGEDVFGDNDDFEEQMAEGQVDAAAEQVDADAPDEPVEEAAAAPAPAAQQEPAAEPPAAQAEPVAEAAAEPTAEAPTQQAAEPEPAPPPRQQYRTDDRATLDTKRGELLAKKATALEQLMDGNIDAKAYAAVDAEVQGQLDDLVTQRALLAANQQSEVQAEQQALVSVAEAARAAGEIDYFTDATAGEQHNMVMDALRRDPANAKLGVLAIARKAHTAVLAMRGVTPKAAAPAPAPAPAPSPAVARTMSPGPPSLRGLPEAASTLAGGGKYENMARKSGLDFIDDFSKLSKAEQDRLLDE